jgi:hypothetical protein
MQLGDGEYAGKFILNIFHENQASELPPPLLSPFSLRTNCESLHHTNLKCELDAENLGLSHITILRRIFIYICVKIPVKSPGNF